MEGFRNSEIDMIGSEAQGYPILGASIGKIKFDRFYGHRRAAVIFSPSHLFRVWGRELMLQVSFAGEGVGFRLYDSGF